MKSAWQRFYHFSLKDLNIRARLLLVCLLVAVPLLCMCGLIIWKEYQGLTQAARHATYLQNQIAVRSLSQWVRTQELELESLSVLPELQHPDQSITPKILEASVRTQRDWNAVALFSTSGNLIASGGSCQASCGVELVRTETFRAALAGRQSMSGYRKCPMSGRGAVMVAVPVRTARPGQRVAPVEHVLVASVDPRAILRLFSGLDDERGAVIAVIDNEKKLLARTLDNDRWLGRDFSRAKSVQAADKEHRGTFEAVGIVDPTPRTYAFDRLPENNWIVVSGIPTSVMYGSAHDRLLMMLLSAGLALGCSVAFAYRFTAYFTGPINELVREAVAIGRGDLTKRVTTQHGGEIGLLARAFNQMAINLDLNHQYKEMVERIADSIRESLDLDQILNTTVLELGAALSASRCCLALLGGPNRGTLGTRELEFNYVWWNPALLGTPLRNRSVMVTDGSMLKLILEQKAILSLDVMDDHSFTPLFEKDEVSPEDWRSIKSLIACPIVHADQPVGMILVHQCERRRAWLDLELELVEAVAGHVALAMEHANLFARTRTLAEQEFLINHIVRATRSSLDTDTILSTVTGELGRALGADYCQIAMPRPDSPLAVTHEYCAEGLRSTRGLSVYNARLDFEPSPERLPFELSSVLGIELPMLKEFFEASRSGIAAEIPVSIITNVLLDSRAYPFREFLHQVGTKSVMAAPLLHNDNLLGVLIVHQCSGEREWNSGEMRLTAAIADQLAVAVSHAELFAQVKHQAITDGLTGLYNHVYFKNRLAEELNRASRKNSPCSLLMIDLDKLKSINDTLGHPIGDQAIRQVARALKTLLRSSDTAARYGGEEFSVILPDTPLSEALLIAERLRLHIHRNSVPGLGHISASIGAACFPSHAQTPCELVDKADRALYEAKHTGRNRVCVWDEPHPQHVAPALELVEPGI